MNLALKRSSRTGTRCRSSRFAHQLISAGATLICAGAVLGHTATAVAAPPARSATPIHASQQLAILDYEHRAYAYPRTNARWKASVPAHRPITGVRTALPVVGHAINRHGQRWLKVRLPGRPNSSTGWIKRAGTQRHVTDWNIQVHLATRRVFVYYAGRLIKTFLAVVGKPSTPTPTGRFFVEESVTMPADEADGPYVLALSARSDALRHFDGGPGQIGIHGRNFLGGTLGQAQSHGCIRLATPDIDWLVARIGPGTPVTIS